jgi:hypothetical protein
MNPNSVLFQLVLLGLTAAIGYFYIYPTIESIGSTQDQIVQYNTERQKVESVNQQLDVLVQRANTLSSEDRQLIDTYLPTRVDMIAVIRTTIAIAEQSGVVVSSFSVDEISSADALSTVDDGNPIIDTALPVDFSVSVSGTYEQIKSLLRLYEQNEYPIEVTSLGLEASLGGFIEAQLNLRTYQRLVAQPSL